MKKALIYSVTGVIVFLVVFFGHASPPESSTVTTQSASVRPTPTATTVPMKQSPVSILTASTDHYAQLLVQGKAILGTTQYSSAAQGTSALHDPNSPASKFSAFHNANCVTSDPGANAMDAYRQASDVSSSAALDLWSEHTNNAASDFCLWAQDTVDWEIGKVSSTQLHADEQKVTADLAKARIDIQSLSK